MTFAPNVIIKATEAPVQSVTTANLPENLRTQAVSSEINKIAQYGVMPVGSVVYYAGVSIPPRHGWLLCDGSTISRTAFPQLWKIAEASIAAGKTDFGVGDGSTTFNLPDARGVSVTPEATPPTVVVDEGGSVNVGSTTPPSLPDPGTTGGGGTIPSGGRPKIPYNLDYFTWF